MAALTKEQPRFDKNNHLSIPKQQGQSQDKPKRQFKKRCPNNNNNNKHNNKEKQSLPKEGQGQPQINQWENAMKHDNKINTSYTPFTLTVHVLIICQHLYTLYSTPSASFFPMRLSSFTELVYITTTCFHIATLLANIFKKTKLERAFVLYGTWVIWIGWAMCLSLIRPENRPDSFLYKAMTPSGGGDSEHYFVNINDSLVTYNIDLDFILAPMNIAPFLMHGKWSTTTLPIMSFFLLLVIRRNHWGLITWEHLVLLEYTRTLKWYRTWCVACTSAGWMLIWEAAKYLLPIPFFDGGMPLYRTDLPKFPGLFNVLWASWIAGMFMMCWWSFWTFQYRGVLWKKEYKEGVVVWSSDGSVCVCGVGC